MRAFLVAQWGRVPLLMQETRLYPWSGKVPYALEQLSPCATAIEPKLESRETATTEPARHSC